MTSESLEPVAWANADDDGFYDVTMSEGDAHCVLERAQTGHFANRNPRIVPLYRQPTLTDAEREAIQRAADWLATHAQARNDIHTAGYLCDDAMALRKLLERLG